MIKGKKRKSRRTVTFDLDNVEVFYTSAPPSSDSSSNSDSLTLSESSGEFFEVPVIQPDMLKSLKFFQPKGEYV